MRLWHQAMIPFLSRQHLLGQHRECCALRGQSWGKKHSTVDYVFKYSPYRLFTYHMLIMAEMKKRGYKPNYIWLNKYYRGKNAIPWEVEDVIIEEIEGYKKIFSEHDDKYFDECIQNLRAKGFSIDAYKECKK